MRRRPVLAGLGTLLAGTLAGCSESRDPVTVETSIHLSDGDRRQTMVDGERDDLDAGQYVWWEFTTNSRLEATYDVRVTAGETVNVYVLTVAEREVFEDEESGFDAVEGSIQTETEGVERTITLDAGEYSLVVANADILPENA
ncbi:hypothetical protein [Halococcoides cellulosivorans]|nr:hypothetical protein [Halococcoides cellulosivorans]